MRDDTGRLQAKANVDNLNVRLTNIIEGQLLEMIATDKRNVNVSYGVL